jgi:hypothetical protein
VVDLDTALDEQLLDVTIGQVQPQIPADRDHDDLGREAEPANADTGGDQPGRAADLMARACLDHLTDERNSAL